MKNNAPLDVRASADLQAYNTLNLPCVVDRLVVVTSDSELLAAIEDIGVIPGNYFILGGGSNLVLPERLSLIAIKLNMNSVSFNQITSDVWEVLVDAGVVWDELVQLCVEKGLRGIENLSLIPGLAGAAPVQNIGAYGVELADVFKAVDVYDLIEHCFKRLGKEECHFAYRDSVFKQEPGRYIILRVVLSLSENQAFNLGYGPLKDLQEEKSLCVSEVRNKVIAIRQAKIPDPEVLPNAGSFFKNPIIGWTEFETLRSKFPDIVSYPVDKEHIKLAAGWLIERVGWKGVKEGPVGVHSEQALVLVNYDAAKQADILALAKKISASVMEIFSVELEIEPIVLD